MEDVATHSTLCPAKQIRLPHGGSLINCGLRLLPLPRPASRRTQRSWAPKDNETGPWVVFGRTGFWGNTEANLRGYSALAWNPSASAGDVVLTAALSAIGGIALVGSSFSLPSPSSPPHFPSLIPSPVNAVSDKHMSFPHQARWLSPSLGGLLAHGSIIAGLADLYAA